MASSTGATCSLEDWDSVLATTGGRPWWYMYRTARSSFTFAALYAVAAILGGVSLWLRPRVLEAIAVAAWSLLAVTGGLSGLAQLRQCESQEHSAELAGDDL